MATSIPLRSARGRWVLAATILGSGMVFLDGTVVNVALPSIQSDLAAPLAGLQWIVDGYALFLASLLLVGGALGDVYGRKRLYILGLLIFTAASAFCGLAPNVTLLIAGRIVQGIGGALLVPGSLAMIKAVIAPEDSAQAIGLWTGLSSVTSAIGPLFGGYLIHAVSWRSIFFLNVPIAAVAVWITARHMPANRDPGATSDLDWLGAILSIAGIGGLTFGLIEGPDRGWGSVLVIAAFVVGVVGVILLPIREWRAHHPLVPLGLFRSRKFSGSNLVTLGVYFCFNGVLFFLVLNLQQVQGYSPLQAGAALLPITILLMVLSPVMGGVMNRFGPRLPMTVGPAIIAAAFLLFMLPGAHAGYLTTFLPALIVMGMGMAIFITPLTATVMGAVPPDEVGVASGVNNAVARVAAVLAIAVLGVVVAARFDSALSQKTRPLPAGTRAALLRHADRLAGDPIPRHLPPAQRRAALAAVQDSYLSGFRWAMGTCAVISAISAALSLATIRS
jgi:EmrB/QacA subfamily drug resistance transporter